jgi:hypothetical protein
MKFFLTILLFQLSVAELVARDIDFKSMYKQLDNLIDNSYQYIDSHENNIKRLRTLLLDAKDDKTKYDMSFNLYLEYKSYTNDSAITYLQQCIRYADKIHRKDLSGKCKSLVAFQCSSSGLYTEALQILKQVSTKDLTPANGLSDYYLACNHVYQELGYYTRLEGLKRKYVAISDAYRDSVYQVMNRDSEDYLLCEEISFYLRGLYQKAMRVNDLRLSKVRPGSRNYAIVAYYRSRLYGRLGDMQMVKYWLIESAKSDIENAVMDQASLWELSDILNKEGDIDRSLKYIRFTWECNNKFGTRMRSWQISPLLSIIDSNYQKQINRQNQTLIIFITIISVMALMLLSLLFFVYRQKKKLSDARNELKLINEKLVVLNHDLLKANDDLDTSNQKLSCTNQKLGLSNQRLNESNRVKEEYIGRFLSMCSQYVDKLDDYRKMVNKKMKNKDLESLFNISRSTEFKEKELDELYANFDSIFLHLFPHFVEDFNAMLKPEVRIHLKDSYRLSTDIRIFALIRLGIDDSSKIAEFLHYSVNTIYNYRARIKNGVLEDRDNFERRVKDLGLSS